MGLVLILLCNVKNVGENSYIVGEAESKADADTVCYRLTIAGVIVVVKLINFSFWMNVPINM